VKLSELAQKEVLNLYNGTRLGRMADSDLIFDPQTGEIEGLLLPGRRGNQQLVPWSAVKKIGEQSLIIECNYSV